ncbi:MAG TPA: helix-turn-helix transcriptional regulator [Virgibacillus sp.]|nr:helix-turn-helix transcriptional regulator [Virgibacillus sp.]
MKKGIVSLKLKAHRKQKNMTQEELAVVLGVSEAKVKRWEMDTAYPNQSEIENIAAALDVPVETFQADRRLGESRMKRTIRYALTSYIIIFVLVLFIRTLKGQGQYNDILSRSVPEILGIVGATFFQNIFIAIVPALIIGFVYYFYLIPREQ